MGETDANSGVRIVRSGTLAHITLDRPKALNALTLPMLRAIRRALDAWRDDASVLAVAVDGAGERGLCAGGDIRAIHRSVIAGDGMAETFWREEYELNLVIATYPKPYVVLMDGLVMGGGVGLSAHGSHRLVTPRTALAMPETSLGFFPDVGGTWLLSRAPGEIGTYLGLTGARISAADAIYCGLADQVIEPGRWPVLLGQLAGIHAREEIGSAVTSFDRGETEPSPLLRHRTEIDQAFGGATVEQIVDALTRQATPFAGEALNVLKARSPMALKVTLAALRHARELRSLKDCLALELRMALPMAARDDFLEGIRAAVIDKDQKPRWKPSKLEDIADPAVSRIVLGSGEQCQ